MRSAHEDGWSISAYEFSGTTGCEKPNLQILFAARRGIMPWSFRKNETGMASEALRLFDDLPEARAAEKRATAPQGAARVLMPNRLQMELRPSDLESLLPEGHRARMVWGYVECQDLSARYEAIKAREGGAGRSAIAPEILYALCSAPRCKGWAVRAAWRA